ncbi:NAD(P)-dependent oxidoreductase [Marinomonas rhizomae]|uniref:NAD-dependent epimerase/dehydratase family protein n=1 Tax=Marinomonas rhizomae TaxID=491948 RepID=UPI00210543D1|nr:NAD(P)-dependent oxidoreductase [Marinomonas rhizomae]UTW00038.1 NAD(P)-dependent oxidoreductase [Marinomonas rhizomae]
MKRVLITGAAGHLGNVMRPRLNDWATEIRLSDIAKVDDLKSNEHFVPCDLGDADAVISLVEGCDAIVHFGGVSTENTFDNILNGNIKGAYNLYEAARKNGVKRIFFASSNHVVGFHDRETLLDAHCAMRPDSMYGLSKCFGELLAQYYYDKFGIESAVVRIGSCFPKPSNRRMLSTWLSEGDLSDLIKKVYAADRLGCTVIYGVSDNPSTWWDNRHAKFIGWTPKDSSAVFENEAYLQEEQADPNDPAVRFQGGGFACAGHFED